MDERTNGRDGGAPYDLDDARSPAARDTRYSPRSASEALQPERVPPPPSRSRAARHPAIVFLNFLLTVVVLCVLGAGGAFFFANYQFEGEGPLEQPRTVIVQRGSSLSTIAELLQRSGMISNRWIFWAGVKFNDEDSNLKAGEYLIPAHASMADIMQSMVSGKAILYSVTVPEGLTSEQIVQRLRDNEVLVGEIAEVPAEGTLLPETYRFTRGDSRQNIINRMRRERDRVLTEVWNRRVAGLPVKTPEELVTLASIVEKETAIADERSRVAAVFINRLNKNMRLQSDPTVIYGVYGGKGKPSDRPVTRSDLDAQNDYNTYQISGLPPGPIANPGRASLEAVINPSRTDDVYFVADGTGGHAFAETYEEHQRNVARWRQIEAKRRQAAEAAVVPAAAAVTPAGDAADGAPASD